LKALEEALKNDISYQALQKQYLMGPLLNEMFLQEPRHNILRRAYITFAQIRVISPILIRFLLGEPGLGADWYEFMMIICLTWAALVF